MTTSVDCHMLRKDVFGANRSLLYNSNPTMQGDSVAHDHDFLEIVLIVGGQGTHISKRGVQPLSRGDFFVLRPGAWHLYQQCEDLQLLNCCCAPELLRRELALLGDDPAVSRLLWTELRDPQMFGVFQSAINEEQTSAAETQLRELLDAPNEPFTVRAGRLLVLLGQLGQVIYPIQLQCAQSIHIAVRECIDRLDSCCDEEWDLSRLSAMTGLNPSYLIRLFKQATGSSPMQYLARHRAAQAADLLVGFPRNNGHRV